MKRFKRIILAVFLPMNLTIWFVCSKEPSHRDGSFEYPQHMFWLRNKKNDCYNAPLYIWRPAENL